MRIHGTIKRVSESSSSHSSFFRMSKFPVTGIRPIRVLFIVDSLYWVIGNFAHQIAKNNPAIHAVTCSQFAIRKTIKRFGQFPTCFDVVHFLRTKTISEFWGSHPIVTTLHHFDSATNLAPFYQSDAVMTVSAQWQQFLTQRGIPESHQALVPFGVDTKVFSPAQDEARRTLRKTFNFPKDAFILGFSSRQISNSDNRKGITCFLQALKKLRQQLPSLATLIMGLGWQGLAKEIRKQGVHCTLAPYEMTHEHVAKFYRAMDLFWVTSRIEGGPVPLLEAMASSLPCISTPVGAALDLIKNNENGYIVPFDSPGLFADLSLQLARDETLRIFMGKQARQTIIDNSQWNHVGEKLQELYRLAIKNFHTHSNQNFCHNQASEMVKRNNQKVSQQNPMSEELFFSKKVQRWLQTCEQVNGLRMMVGMKEWKTASRLGYQTLSTTPFDASLWKEIIGAVKKREKLRPSQTNYKHAHTLFPPKQPL